MERYNAENVWRTIASIKIIRKVNTRIVLLGVIKKISAYTDFRHHCRPLLWGFIHLNIGQGHVIIDLNKTTLSHIVI